VEQLALGADAQAADSDAKDDNSPDFPAVLSEVCPTDSARLGHAWEPLPSPAAR